MAETETQAKQNQAEEKPSKETTSKKSTAKKAKKTAKKTTTRRRPAKKRKAQTSGAKEEPTQPKTDGAAGQSPESAAGRPDTAKQKEETNVEAVAEASETSAAQSDVGIAPPPEAREQVQASDIGEKSQTQPNMQWGRRSKRTGPIVREDQTQAGRVIRPATIAPPQKVQGQTPPEQISTPAPSGENPADAEVQKPETEKQAALAPEHTQDSGVPEPVQTDVAPEQIQVGEAPEQIEDDAEADDDLETEAQTELSDQDSRRSRRRRRGRGRDRDRRGEDPRNRPETQAQRSSEDPRNRPETQAQRSSEDSRNRPDQQRKEAPVQRSNEDPRNRGRDESRPSKSLTDLMAETWTEDKARRFLSEGLLTQLSPRLLGQSDIRIPDAAALREPLRIIRKVLADECMVADDATDVMLLDLVMNALIDRIDVCRLQARSQSPEDIEVLLDLRYKADRRLIEALTALKNA